MRRRRPVATHATSAHRLYSRAGCGRAHRAVQQQRGAKPAPTRGTPHWRVTVMVLVLLRAGVGAARVVLVRAAPLHTPRAAFVHARRAHSSVALARARPLRAAAGVAAACASALCVARSLHAESEKGKLRMIIDCDAGVDDAQAIVAAIKSRHVEVVAITGAQPRLAAAPRITTCTHAHIHTHTHTHTRLLDPE